MKKPRVVLDSFPELAAAAKRGSWDILKDPCPACGAPPEKPCECLDHVITEALEARRPNVEAETIAAVVAWLRAEADANDRIRASFGDSGESGAAKTKRGLARRIERGDWRKS